MLSAIIRGRTTSCCFLGTRNRVEVGLCNAASDWEDSCGITIKKPRELAGTSWMIPASLAVELCLSNENYDCWQKHNPICLQSGHSRFWVIRWTPDPSIILAVATTANSIHFRMKS
jgi:hypothetical protein